MAAPEERLSSRLSSRLSEKFFLTKTWILLSCPPLVSDDGHEFRMTESAQNVLAAF